MHRLIKSVVGTLLFWSVLVCCALLLITDGFSFAGNGHDLVYETPCIVVNANCPLCCGLDESPTAYYGMAGQTRFTFEGDDPGPYAEDGSINLVCYKKATCKERTRSELQNCTSTGCADSTRPVGCKSLLQLEWVNEMRTYPFWKDAPEE